MTEIIVTDRMDAAASAAAMLQARGIPCYFEPFDGSIHVDDDGAHWHFGTTNETWGADIMRDIAVGDIFAGAHLDDVPSDSLDAEAIAAAIEAAVVRGVGVQIWRDTPDDTVVTCCECGWRVLEAHAHSEAHGARCEARGDDE